MPNPGKLLYIVAIPWLSRRGGQIVHMPFEVPAPQDFPHWAALFLYSDISLQFAAAACLKSVPVPHNMGNSEEENPAPTSKQMYRRQKAERNAVTVRQGVRTRS